VLEFAGDSDVVVADNELVNADNTRKRKKARNFVQVQRFRTLSFTQLITSDTVQRVAHGLEKLIDIIRNKNINLHDLYLYFKIIFQWRKMTWHIERIYH
jgi:hypothetical protein